MSAHLFEQASRLSLRFDSSKGLLSVEDLWQLPLTSAKGASLESIGQVLQNEIKSSESSTFRITTDGVSENANNAALELVTLRFEILKHIIAVRQGENAALKAASDKKAQKTDLLALLRRKKDKELEDAPIAQIEAMITAL